MRGAVGSEFSRSCLFSGECFVERRRIDNPLPDFIRRISAQIATDSGGKSDNPRFGSIRLTIASRAQCDFFGQMQLADHEGGKPGRSSKEFARCRSNRRCRIRRFGRNVWRRRSVGPRRGRDRPFGRCHPQGPTAHLESRFPGERSRFLLVSGYSRRIGDSLRLGSLAERPAFMDPAGIDSSLFGICLEQRRTERFWANHRAVALGRSASIPGLRWSWTWPFLRPYACGAPTRMFQRDAYSATDCPAWSACV